MSSKKPTLSEVLGLTKKLTAEDLKKLISETAMDEKASPEKVEDDRFPMNLSSVDQEFAQRAVSTDPSEEDVIPVTGGSQPVAALKPSQSSMNIEQALGQALAMIMGNMPTGGDLGAFISSDNHIMDGHHRWVATSMVDPSKEVGGMIVDFPADKLIPILNALTAGKFGRTTGKAGTGGFDQFAESPIKAQLEEFLENGIGGKFPQPPEYVQQAIEKFTGKKGDEAKDAAVEKFVDNLSNIKFETPAGAPARPDMPVIDGEAAIGQAVQALTSGEIDVNPPYQTEEAPEGEGGQESLDDGVSRDGDDVILERWSRLAGLHLLK